MGLRSWIRNFFGFSRAQTYGFIVLLPLLLALILFEPVHRRFLAGRKNDFSRERNRLDSLSRIWDQQEHNTIPQQEEIRITLSRFNPNEVSQDELLSLGFSAGLARRLINYRNKGGKFSIKSDLLKLYGMDSLFFNSLLPYIDLPDQRPSHASVTENNARSEPTPFDLNRADTTQLKSIYGIGKILSARIVKYRESLGGFLTYQQVYEVYGLDSTAIDHLFKRSFILEDFQPRQLNINTADEVQLSSHPYISRSHSRAIVTYRFQHGHYKSVDDLQQILLLDEKSFIRAKPYLTVD